RPRRSRRRAERRRVAAGRRGPGGQGSRRPGAARSAVGQLHVEHDLRHSRAVLEHERQLHHREDHLPVLLEAVDPDGTGSWSRDAEHHLRHRRRRGAVAVGWLSNALSARRDEERGAILVLSAVFMVVMVVLVALAVDIGFLGNDKRDDHKMADLAALDGMRYMIDHSCPGSSQQQTDVTNAVNQSLARNGYSTSGHGNSVTVELGTVDPTSKVFSLVADKCTATAVRVTVGSVTGFRFQP